MIAYRVAIRATLAVATMMMVMTAGAPDPATDATDPHTAAPIGTIVVNLQKRVSNKWVTRSSDIADGTDAMQRPLQPSTPPRRRRT